MDPDTEAARRHFERGIDLYAHEKYDEAIVEFERARELRNAPALEYNIARCHDRLEHWREAADAYQRYLDGTPNAPERASLTERIAQLRARQARQAPVAAPAVAAPPVAAPTTAMSPPAAASAAPPLPAAPAATVERSASRPERALYRRGWFWAATGGAAAVVVAGVVLGVVLGSGSDRSHAIQDVRFP